jgi:hypothetical protein
VAEFRNEADLIKFVSQLRRDHAPIRAEVAARTALGLAYANGHQWSTVGTGVFGQVWVDTWEEDWNPKSSEIRVTNNKMGPLIRRIGAATNATMIESVVTPPKHLRSFEAADRANVSQMVLNGLAEDIGMTRVARQASTLRWQAGTSVLVVDLTQKKKELPPDVARGPDGEPVSIADKWVRWDHQPLSELIWDPANVSNNLEDHAVLMLERIFPLKKFMQYFGRPEDYGFKTEDLPTVNDLAPHLVSTAGLAGTALYQTYVRQREEKAIRAIQFYDGDPRDPNRWPRMFLIFDTSMDHEWDRPRGKVANFDNPESPFGHHQRPLFLLHAFKRPDAVLSHGAPHILMSDQDRLNVLESIKFQRLTNVVYGNWLVDERSTNRETFASDLATGIGGILRWNSASEGQPPQFVTPDPPRQEFVLMGAEVAQGMRDQMHISEINLGKPKSHVPQSSQQQLLREANVVVDNVILEDIDMYSDALKVTLGTVRKASEGPNRMLARLRDRHGFKADDLEVFLEVDPRNIPLVIHVRQHSVTSRSSAERVQQLLLGASTGSITPKQVAIAMAQELEQPILRSHELQIQFCERAVRQILAGADWPGMPHLDLDFFLHVAEEALYGLNILKEDDRAAIARLQEAIIVQKNLAMENQPFMPPEVGGGPQQQALQQGGGGGARGPQGTGAPESINPLAAPSAAAGGLPVGIS